MSASFGCCVLSGRGLVRRDRSLVQMSSTECRVSVCELETSTMRRPGLDFVCGTKRKKFCGNENYSA